MTTAPREKPTLTTSLNSLTEAGWSDVRLFAEPESVVPREFCDLPINWRAGKLGAFANWHLAFTELFLRAPDADAYLLCQDDVIFAKGLRDFLEVRLWPNPTVGVVSVYAAGRRSQREPAGFALAAAGWDTRGALALIFPNASLKAFLGHPLVMRHPRRARGEGTCHIDALVGEWCRRTGLGFYEHAPSLAQHIGDTSTLVPGLANHGHRRAEVFTSQIGKPPESFQP
jgi:hypothetical protein